MKNFNKNNNKFVSKNFCSQFSLNFNHKCAKCSCKLTTKLKAISTVIIIVYSCNTAFLTHQQVFAQSVAYRNATNERHPIMDAAHNGVSVVHIAPPSSSGISHNQFEQFNVDKSGLIFNNSSKDVQSQLAGWIAANPQLGHEPAKVILSEVMSANSSLLLGPMEVAGRTADIIIANPNGITCDGCGFINVSRASLVVGRPEWSTTELLDSFRVDNNALLKIGEKGLNALQVAELDLIARTMQVGGEVWANKLNTILGANRVFVKTLQTKPIDIGGGSPQFALDVKSVGGMFAKQIYLIATEYGVGVNSMGRLETLEGSLQLLANGDLKVNRIISKDNLLIRTSENVEFLGRILAENRSIIEIGKSLEQKGYIDSKGIIEITANNFDNSGTIIQRGKDYLQIDAKQNLLNSGEIYSAGLLKLTTNSLSNDKGLFYSDNNIFIKSEKIDLIDSKIESDLNINLNSENINSYRSDIVTNKNILIDSKNNFNNNLSSFIANNNIDINSNKIQNNNSLISAKEHIKIDSSGKINNTGSKIIAEKILTINGLGIDNTEGVLSSQNSNINLQSGDLVNVKGNIVGDNSLVIKQGLINNEDGKIITKSNLILDTKNNNLINNRGLIKSENGLSINSQSVYNASGVIVSEFDNKINAKYLDNASGNISGNKTSILLGDGKLDNSNKGKIEGKSDLNLDVGEFYNKEGNLLSDKNLKIDTKNYIFNNISGSIHTKGDFQLQSGEFRNDLGKIAASGKIDVNASLVSNEKGKILSSNDLKLNVTSILNKNGEIEGKNVTLNLYKNGNLNNEEGKLVSIENFSYNGGELNNLRGTVSSGKNLLLDTANQKINNTEGNLVAEGAVTVRVGDFNNKKGNLGSKGDLKLTSSDLNNLEGSIFVKEKLQISVEKSDIINSKGKIISEGDLILNALNIKSDFGQIYGNNIALNLLKGSNLSNNEGQVVARNNLVLQGGVKSNEKGKIVAEGTLTLNSQEKEVNNDLGQIIAKGTLQLDSHALQNNTGTIGSSEADLKITSHAVNSEKGEIVAHSNVTIDAGNYDIENNNKGKIISQKGDIFVTARNLNNTSGEIVGSDIALNLLKGSNLSNKEGQVVARNNLVLQGGVKSNEKGKIVAEGTLTLNSQGNEVNNNSGEIVAKGKLDLDSHALQNEKGTIGSSEGEIKITSHAVNSEKGKIVAKKEISLTATGYEVNNNEGHILSEKGNLTLIGATLNNTSGEIVGSDIALNLLKGSNLSNKEGQVVARNNLVLQGGVKSNEKGKIVAEGTLTLNSQEEEVNNNLGQIIAKGALQLDSHALQNNTGTIGSSEADLKITSHAVNSEKGKIVGSDVALNLLKGSNLSNNEGQVVARNNLVLQGGVKGNEKGKIFAEGTLTLNSQEEEVNNNLGQIIAKDALQLDSHALQNAEGTIGSSEADLKITSHAVNSEKGKIVAKKDISINTNAQNIVNIEGKILSAEGNVTVTANNIDSAQGEIMGSDVALNLTKDGNLSNNDGQVLARNNLILQGGVAGNKEGKIVAEGMLTLNSQGNEVNNNSGEIVAKGKLDLDSHALQNEKGTIGSSEGEIKITSHAVNSEKGKIVAKKEISLTATGHEVNNNEGHILSEKGNLTLIGATLHNTSGEIVGSDIALNLLKGSNLSNNEGQVVARNNLVLQGGVKSNEKGKIVAEGTLTLNSQEEEVNNNLGQIIAKGTLQLDSHALQNKEGTIGSSEGEIKITSHAVNSEKGKIVGSDVALNLLKGSDLSNNDGQVVARNNLVLQGGVKSNEKGKIVAEGTLTLNSQEEEVNNNLWQIIAKGTLQLDSHALQNKEGTIGSSEGEIKITSHAVNSEKGKIVAKKDISINTNAQNIVNIEGKILSAEGNVTVTANNIDSAQGEIMGSDVALNLLKGGNLSNNDGQVLARNNLILQGGVAGNKEGKIVAEGMLTLNSQGNEVNNNSGEIVAKGKLDLDSHALQNEKGTIGSSEGEIKITSHAVNSEKGKIVAKKEISLTATGHEVNNNEGHILSEKGNLTLIGATLHNTSGEIVGSDVALNLLKGSDLSNNDGQVLARNNLILQGGVAGNKEGKIVAEGMLTLNSQGNEVNNNSGEIVAKGKLDLDSHALQNEKGTIGSSEGEIKITSHAVNSEKGEIVAHSNVTIDAGNYDIENNNKGKIISQKGDIFVTARNINNTFGEIIIKEKNIDNPHSGSITLNLLKGSNLSNNYGKVLASKDLKLDGGINGNNNGQITAFGILNINTQGQKLNNQSGTVASGLSLSITSHEIDNSQVGKIFTSFPGSDLDINTNGQKINNNKGKILASGNQTIKSGNINNAEGELLGFITKLHLQPGSLVNNPKGQIVADEKLELFAGVENNDLGLIASQQDMVIKTQGQDIINNNGVILSRKNLNITANNIYNNLTGQIFAEGSSDITSSSIYNKTGLLFSGGVFKVNSLQIDNTAGEIVAHNEDKSITRSLNINTNSQDILNVGGKIKTSGNLIISAKDVTNSSQGQIQGENVTFTASKFLNNNGEIFSKQALNFTGKIEDNFKGKIASLSDAKIVSQGLLNNYSGILEVHGKLLVTTGTLNNNSGSFAARNAIEINSGNIENINGKIFNNNDAVNIIAKNGNINNTSGLIYASAALGITGNSLNNNNGKLSGNAQNLKFSNNLNNTSGNIIANNKLEISSGELNNSAGVIAGKIDVTINLKRESLTNTNRGRIHAGSSLDIKSGNVHNNNGIIYSGSYLKSDSYQIINKEGVIVVENGNSLNKLDINTNNHQFDNTQGTIISKVNAEIRSGDFDNVNNGKVFANSLTLNASNVNNNSVFFNILGNATLKTQSFNNNYGTLFAGNKLNIKATGDVQNISANIKTLGLITLNANNLYNNDGNILSLNNIDIESNNDVLNNSGTINSGNNLNIKSSSLDNNSGSLYAQNKIDINSPIFSNNSGTVVADQNLILRTSSSNVEGKIISQGNADLDFKNYFTNNAQVSAKNNLTITANGISNKNKIIAGKNLEITSSNNFTNHAQAEVIADSVNIDAFRSIDNCSKIDGKTVNLSASRILNIERISGDNLTLTAQTGLGEIKNDVGGKIVGVSESGEVKLTAKEIRNVNSSQILSKGGLTFTASKLENISTKIVAKKFINFDVDRVYNKPAVDPEKVKIEGKPENLPNSGMETVFKTGRREGLTERKKGTLTRKTDTYSLKQNSDPSEILSGGDISFKNYIGNFYSKIAAAGTSRYSIDKDEGAEHDNLKNRADVNLNENQNVESNFNEYNKGTLITIDNILKTQDEYYFGKKYHAKKLISIEEIANRVQIDDIYEWPKSIWDLFGNFFTDGSDLETKTYHYDQLKIGKIKPLAEATNISGAVVNTSSYFNNQNTNIAVNPLTDSADTPSLGSVETSKENYKKDVSRDGASFIEKRSINSVSLPQLKSLQFATHQEKFLQSKSSFKPENLNFVPKTNSDADNLQLPSVSGAALPVTKLDDEFGYKEISVLDDKSKNLEKIKDKLPEVKSTRDINLPTAQTDIDFVHKDLSTDYVDRQNLQESNKNIEDSIKINSVNSIELPSVKTDKKFDFNGPSEINISNVNLNSDVTIDKVNIRALKGTDFTTANFNDNNSSQIKFYSRNALYPDDVMLTLSMPGSRYFDFRKAQGYRYLIEKNPSYVEYNKFLSHDKYTEKLQLNPERQLKIYGDQFDSKKELGDQAVVLSGQQFLTNYQENEYKFQNLLNSGKMVAQSFQITPGTQLSDEQMATLTSDLIVDVNKDVDQVVVNVKNLLKTDLKSNGSLMIFGKVDLKISGDFNNTSSMYIGSGKIEAENIVNNPYATIFANSLTLKALNDIKNISGDIKGSGDNSSIILNANRDIHLETKAMDEYFIVNGQKQKNTRVDRVATVSGDTLKLIAGRDINKIGANLYSKNETRQEAGRDIIAKAAVTEKELLITNNKTTSGFFGEIFNTSSERIEENSVTHHVGKEVSEGNSIIIAKNNVNYHGVEINDDQANLPQEQRKFNSNQNVIIQGANVTIAGVKDTKLTHDEYHFSQGEGIDKKYSETIVGGKVTAGNSITIKAFEHENNTDSNSKSGNILLQGSAITAVQGDATFYADNKIDVLSESLKSSSYSYSKSTNDGLFSSKTTTTQGESERDGVYGSRIGGKSVVLQAGKGGEKKGDILVSGSQIASDQKTVLKAGNNVTIEAATEQTYSSFHESTHTSGIFASGDGIFGFTIGTQNKDKGNKAKENLIASSEVGSASGTLIIDAGNTFSQTGGSKLSALGDVTILAEKIKTEAGVSTVLEENYASQSTSGLSIGAANPVVGAAKGVVRTADNMNKVEDDRFKGLALLSNSLAAKNAMDALQKSPQDLGGVKVKYTIGESKSGQSSIAESTQVHKSGIYTKGNLIVRAQGAGKESGIDLSGSSVIADGEISVKAEGNILMQAAQKTTERRSSQWNSGWELGIGANAGKSTGITVEAGASGGEGWSKSHEIQHVNTVVEGKQGVEVVSGGDTTLKGAQVKGKFIKADIAGNLHIESLQDSKVYNSKEHSFGVSASLCVPPVCAGASDLSINGSLTNMASNYKSVIEQSGFLAGSGGYQVDVGGHTQLIGGMIASNQEAKEKKLNKFSTETLDFVDLKNEAEYDVTHAGGGVSVGNKVSVLPPSFIPDNGNATSLTRSVIDEGALEIRNDKKQLALTGKTTEEIQTTLHRDSSTAHQKADELFNEEQIRLKIGIVNDFSKEFGTFISNRGQEAEQKEKELEHALKNSEEYPPEYIEQLKQEYESAAKWAPGGEYRQVATALAAAFSGKLSATGTELVQSFAANYLQSIGAEKIKELAPLLGGEGGPGHTALHAVLGCVAGAMADSCSSRAFGAASGVLINSALSSLEDTQNLSAAERENRINTVTSLVAGMSAAAGLSAPNAAMTSARLEGENNAAQLVSLIVAILTGGAATTTATTTVGAAGAALVATLMIADKVDTVNELSKDIYDVINGEKTLQQLAQEKGEEYVIGLLTTKALGTLVTAVKSGAPIVIESVDKVTKKVKQQTIELAESEKDKIKHLAKSGEEFLQKVKAKGKDSKQIAQNLPDADGKLPGTKEKVADVDGKAPGAKGKKSDTDAKPEGDSKGKKSEDKGKKPEEKSKKPSEKTKKPDADAQPAVKLAARDKRELAAFNKKADEVLIKQGYSKENIDKLRVLYEVKVGAKNLDDVLKEKGNAFFKNDEFKELAAKEGLGIARNARGQQVLEITINSGTTWNWSKELSYPKPNRVYKVNGQVHYQTDELGRVFDKQSELTYENWQKRGRNGHQQRNAGKLGEKDDHGSHLLAHMLGGPGEKINLVPMNKDLNGGEWLKMEMELNNALKEKKKINFNVKIEYEGNSKRPKRFEVEYKIDDGKAIEHSWNNTPGGK